MRPALFAVVVSLWGPAAVSAAREQDLATQLEAGFATRAPVRGIEQAREGVFAALRLSGESFRADVRLHQSFRHSNERLAALRFGYDMWENPEGAGLELRAAHRRFADRGSAPLRAAAHATELGVVFKAAPIRAFVPSVSYNRDLRRDADIFEGRLAHEFALTRWGAFLTASVFAGWIDADDVSPDRSGASASDAYAYFGAEARLPYRMGERTMLVLAAHASAAHGASGDWSALPQASRSRAGLDLSLTFDF